MIAGWMVYCAETSALLALAALALERGFRLRGAPVRWVWVGAMLGSLSLAALPWIAAQRPSATDGEPVAATGGVGSAAADQWIVTSIGSLPPTPSLFPSLESLDTSLLLLWALLSASGLLFLLTTHGKLARRRRRWRRTTVDGVPVLVSRDVGPAVIGFLDAAIVIPEWVLEMDAAKRVLVLSHEEEHLRARDAGLLALALVSVAFMPWNAALWWQGRRLRHAVEMDCDARVVRRCADVRGYSALLVEVGERISMPAVAFAAFSESTSFLERRIRTMFTLRTRRWKLALSGSIAAGVGFLVLACEAPLPTMPSAAREPEPTANTAPEVTPKDARADSPAAPAEEAERRPVPLADAHQLPTADDERATAAKISGMVERMQPEVFANGLPFDRAVWIAVDREGKARTSWIGPNIYINIDGGHYPNRAALYPAGSAARERALAELEQAREAEQREHAPDMTIRAGRFTLWYRLGPAHSPTIVYIVAEAPGILGARPLPLTR
jgi:beta-lactamase regulating signal transducer with metallopeptidase domain